MDSGGGSLVRVLPVEADSKVVDAEIIDVEVVESTTQEQGPILQPPVDLWGAFVSGVAEGVRRGFRGG